MGKGKGKDKDKDKGKEQVVRKVYVSGPFDYNPPTS